MDKKISVPYLPSFSQPSADFWEATFWAYVHKPYVTAEPRIIAEQIDRMVCNWFFGIELDDWLRYLQKEDSTVAVLEFLESLKSWRTRILKIREFDAVTRINLVQNVTSQDFGFFK